MPSSPVEPKAVGLERAEASLWHALQRGVRNNVIGEPAVQLARKAGLVVLAHALAPSYFTEGLVGVQGEGL